MQPLLPDSLRPETYGLGTGARLGVLSAGIIRQRKIFAPFLEPWGRLVSLSGMSAFGRTPDAIVGWGLKGRARMEAGQRRIPFLALEDGFIRSLGLPGRRDRLLSLVIDPIGIYYDASRPSALEQLIERVGDGLCPDLEGVRTVMHEMVTAHLGKFNDTRDLTTRTLKIPSDVPLIVVVDQIQDDLSIAGGGASAETFLEMLETAQAEHPHACIVVKAHPRAGVNGRVGHLTELAPRLGLPIVDGRTAFLSLARRASRIFTVTSHAGFEALMADIPVTCFGTPFYAGWGLTDDRRPCPRRKARPSLETLVWAAYCGYPTYRDPLFDRPSTVQMAVRLAARARAHGQLNAKPSVTLGLGNGKLRQIRPFLDHGGGGCRTDRATPAALDRARRRGDQVVFWASGRASSLAPRARARGLDIAFAEDGFLRSVGLGRHYVAPASLVFDRTGIYYDCRGPSDLETLLERTKFSEALLSRAQDVVGRLRTLGLSKYNCGRRDRSRLGAPPGDGRTRILVPGQVEQDASVRCSAPLINTNLGLLARVRQDFPNAFIAYKPHPDIEFANRAKGLGTSAVLDHADVILDNMDPMTALRQTDEVATMTSQLGFEALVMGLTVHTYGGPFYAGWGLTKDRLTFMRRTRTLTLEELVAGALILYPRYVDPVTGIPCDVEDIMERFVLERGNRDHHGTVLPRLLLGLWWHLRPTPP